MYVCVHVFGKEVNEYLKKMTESILMSKTLFDTCWCNLKLISFQPKILCLLTKKYFLSFILKLLRNELKSYGKKFAL